MIYEFAVDPNVLSNWSDFRYIIEKFGVQNGRLISRFPKAWKRMVYEACENCKVIEKKKIEEKLISIDGLLLKNSREYNSKNEWIENAIEQNSIKQFKAIISNFKSNDNDEIISASDLTEDNIYFKVEREHIAGRNINELCSHVSPLISFSTEILFVDQHFCPRRIRYRSTLEGFLKSINPDKLKLVEYHIALKNEDGYYNEDFQSLSRIIPKNLSVKFIRWKSVHLGESLHPRYILTDIGGIRIEKGLDIRLGDDDTDISLLSHTLYMKRLAEYRKETSPFEFEDEIIITGI
jgi:hypothetical protein